MSSYLKIIKDMWDKLSIPKNNYEVAILSLILVFAIFVRTVPFSMITIVTILIFVSLISLDFYLYVNKRAHDENKNIVTTNFSWGFVKEKTEMITFKTLVNYLSNKDFGFYKNYLMLNLQKIIFGIFLFGDLVIAFKNLDMKNAGIYIAMSIFCKFVFIAYIFMRQTYLKSVANNEKTNDENINEDTILEIFYTQINTLLSSFAVLFIFFFMLSRYISEIFFGNSFYPYQSSLPFILLANISLVILACVYLTAKMLDESLTNKIVKIYSVAFFVLFVFMNVNYLDNITYFVIGASALLSIFIYNFVIKKPDYIKRTYNFLF
jgi:hypothetical protein